MRTVAFVPIKFNSTRLKNKNILPFGSGEKKRPLLQYIFDILSKVKDIDEIYCYCSEEAVKQYLPSNVRYLKRDTYLDGNAVTSNELLYYFAKDVMADYYVLTHATNPLISPETIESVVRAVKYGSYDSAITVRRLQDLMWIDGKPNFDPACAPLTQDIKPIYQETYGAICLKRNLIITEKRRAGYHPAFIEVSQFEAVDINTQEDFDFACALLDYMQPQIGK